MTTPYFYLYLFGAGGLGVVLRYLLTQVTVKMSLTGLPFGTLIANVAGSFLMGFFAVYLASKLNWGAQAQTILMTGLLGGFTTFSAFSIETIRLLESNQTERAIVYVLLSIALTLSFCFLGLLCARKLL